MNSLFSVREADREVIISLLKEILRRIEVSKLLQDQEGNLYIAHEFEAITAGEAQTMLADFQSDVSALQAFLAPKAQEASDTSDSSDQTAAAGSIPVTDDQTAASTDVAAQPDQTAPAAPADPSTASQSTDQSVPAPDVQQAAPVDPATQAPLQ